MQAGCAMRLMQVAYIEIPWSIIGGVLKYSCVQDLSDAVLQNPAGSVIGLYDTALKSFSKKCLIRAQASHQCKFAVLVQPGSWTQLKEVGCIHVLSWCGNAERLDRPKVAAPAAHMYSESLRVSPALTPIRHSRPSLMAEICLPSTCIGGGLN